MNQLERLANNPLHLLLVVLVGLMLWNMCSKTSNYTLSPSQGSDLVIVPKNEQSIFDLPYNMDCVPGGVNGSAYTKDLTPGGICGAQAMVQQQADYGISGGIGGPLMGMAPDEPVVVPAENIIST